MTKNQNMAAMMAAQRNEVNIPPRFSVSQRVEHAVLAISFTVLAVTGLVQKFAVNSLSERLIGLMGGIEWTRIIHRGAAVLFALCGVYHVIAIAYRFFVLRLPMTMLPGLKDLSDMVQSVAYNLFLRKAPPRMPRYNFAEKLEYWALIWGGLIMIVTGFMLWNPLITTQYLPGQFIPAAKAAHGGEAILAVLAILVWHVYNVHIKMFNKSMFTGRMTPHQMEEEHGEEWDLLVAGGHAPGLPEPSVRIRRLIFIPAAFLFACAGIGGIYWAATAEATAISSLPGRDPNVPIYSPSPSSGKSATSSAAPIAPAIPHPVKGQGECYQCHSRSGLKPVPADHRDRPLESCLICHKLGSRVIPQGGEGPGVGEAVQPVGQKIPVPKAIPHSVEGALYQNCAACHGLGKIKPFPDNHAAYPAKGCTACHLPGSAARGGDESVGDRSEAERETKIAKPKAVPHPTDQDPYKNCSICHGLGKTKAFPQDHTAYPIESCTTCHR